MSRVVRVLDGFRGRSGLSLSGRWADELCFAPPEWQGCRWCARDDGAVGPLIVASGFCRSFLVGVTGPVIPRQYHG